MASPFTKNIFLRFAITLPISFSGLIVLPLLTRLYTQDMYGIWLQINLVKGLLFNLLSLRLETALLRYLPGENNKECLIKSVYTVTIAFSLCFFIFVFLFKGEISLLIFGKQGFEGLLLIAYFWIVISALKLIGLETLRSQEKIATVSIRETLSSLWLVGGVVLAYLMNLKIQDIILICMIGDSIILIWILFQIGVPIPFNSLFNSIKTVRKIFSYSLPLIFNSLFLWFTGSIDRLIIVNFLGLSAVSIYGVTLQVSLLLSVFLSPITFVLFPRSITAWSLNNKEDVNKAYSHSLSLTLILGLPALVGITIISKGIIPILAGKNYSTDRSLIFFLLLANLAHIVYQNHISIIHLVEKTYFLPILFLSTAVINYFFCYFFVVKYGIRGAAVSRFIAYATMSLVVTVWGRRYIKFTIPWWVIFKMTIASALMGSILLFMPMNNWLQLLITVISGVFIYMTLIFMFKIFTIKQLRMMISQ